jgi:hypothetical protein
VVVVVTTIPSPAEVLLGGTPEVGQILTVRSANGNFTGDFFWYSGTNAATGPWTPITAGVDGTTQKLTISEDLTTTGPYVIATRYDKDSGKYIESKPVLVRAVSAGIVYITGTLCEKGQTLTAHSDCGSFIGNFYWYSADSATAATWTEISSGIGGQDSSKLYLDDSNVGQYIRAIRADSSGKYVWSDPMGPVTAVREVTISKSDVLVDTYTATSKGDNFTDNFTWEVATSQTGPWNSAGGTLGGTFHERVKVTTSSSAGYIRAIRSGVKSNILPISPSYYVYISGLPVAGQTLKATSFAGDLPYFPSASPTGGFKLEGPFTWWSADSSTSLNWTLIYIGENLPLTTNLLGKYIRVSRNGRQGYESVNPRSAPTYYSAEVGPVLAADGTIAISGNPEAGQKLKATISGTLNGICTWYSADADSDMTSVGAWRAIGSGVEGADDSELRLGNDLVGKYILAVRDGAVSNVLGPVVPATPVTIGSTVTIRAADPNRVKVGDKLTTESVSVNGNFTGDFIWYYASSPTVESSSWYEVAGGVGVAYKRELTLTADLAGKFIRARRFDSADGEYKWSNMLGPVVTEPAPPSPVLDGGGFRTFADAGMATVE